MELTNFIYQLYIGHKGNDLEEFIEHLNDDWGIIVLDAANGSHGSVELTLQGSFISLVEILLIEFENDIEQCAWEIEQLVLQNVKQ